MRELIPKICAVVGAAVGYLLVGNDFQGQGSAGLFLAAKEGFQAGALGTVLGYGAGHLVALPLPKSVTVNANDNFSLGVNMLAAGNPRSALAAFQESLEAAVGDKKADSWYNIAVCHVRLGRQDAALKALRQALTIDPGLANDIKDDEDFASLRSNEVFDEVVRVSAPPS
jgi:tetratricopeptide (TPR) repeat protein